MKGTVGAAVMVGDAVLLAKACGDFGGQIRMLEMLGNGFNEAKRYAQALALRASVGLHMDSGPYRIWKLFGDPSLLIRE